MMVIISPEKTQNKKLKTFSTLPQDYTCYSIPATKVTGVRWDKSVIINQTIEHDNEWLQFCIIHAEETVVLEASVPENRLFLSCLLKGHPISCTVQGFGHTNQRTSHMSLCHLPAQTTHYATVEKGFYMLLYISVRHIAALEHKAIPLALRYIVTQHQRGDISSLIQRNIKMDTPAASIIKKIKSNNLSVIRLSHDLLQGYTARLTTYFSDLPILDSYYLLAIKAKKYIGENLDKRLQISTVAVHFKICKTILKNSFSAVIGQSFHEYVSEVRLQKAHAMLSTGNFRVHEAAAAVGLKEDYLRIPFSKRFGVTPAQFLRIIQAEQLEEALLGEASGTA